MRIASDRSDAWIAFEPMPEIGASSFWIAASLGGREVSYGDIALLRKDAFLRDLQDAKAAGSGRVTLEGTYDFRLTVRFAAGRPPVVAFYLAECLSPAEPGERDFMRLALQGSFPLSSEHGERLAGDFRALLG
ncbi:MAG: hypothetical protein HS109_14590 [Burkholderiales bacterium]|nr:hypothetical protein [Burkholderiales bacterium]MCE7877035.1 hypothetical protein [Betaproteobacteria bacterium PRO3]